MLYTHCQQQQKLTPEAVPKRIESMGICKNFFKKEQNILVDKISKRLLEV